mgnify:CR=1 FL=1
MSRPKANTPEGQRAIRTQIMKLALRIEIALENLTEAKDQELSQRKKELETEQKQIKKELLEKYGKPTADAMIESAKKHIEILEKLDF